MASRLAQVQAFQLALARGIEIQRMKALACSLVRYMAAQSALDPVSQLGLGVASDNYRGSMVLV